MQVLKEFPTLYESASNTLTRGTLKEWRIKVVSEGDEVFIVTEYGKKGGKLAISRRKISSGKNIGKKNETTVQEQAISEATSKFEKKKKTGYSPRQLTIQEPDIVWTERRNETVVSKLPKEERDEFKFFPMLALDFSKRGQDIVFPCYIQPKLDGVRGLLMEINNETRLFSRNFIEYTVFDSITKKTNVPKGIILDGELFSHEIPFEEITGLARNHSVKKLSPERLENLKFIHFHVFDLYDQNNPDLTFEERYDKLMKMQNLFGNQIVIVDTKELNAPEDLEARNSEYIEQGYEGTILRNKNSKYQVNKRSKHLQKYKLFRDSEFKVVDYIVTQDSEFVFVCEYTDTNGELNTFKCRPRGTVKYKQDLILNSQNDFGKFKGRKYTVRYQELSQKGCPRFPVGIAFRDYE